MPFLDLEGLQILWSNILSKLSNKVDTVEGKQLSTNDYTNEEKSKLASLAQSDWAASENEPGHVLNRTHYDTVTTKTLYNGTFTATAGTLTRINSIPDEVIVNYPDISVVRATFDGKACTITATTNKWELRDPNGQLVFTMNYDTAKGAQCLVSAYAGSGAHTLVIEVDEITAVPLDEKYIPNTIPRRVDIPHMAMPDWGAAAGEAGYVKNRTHYEEKGIIIPNTIIDVPSSDLYAALPVLSEALVVGNQYIVGLDNENYTCVAWQEGEIIYLGNGNIYPGISKGENVPFSIDTYPDGTAYLNVQIGKEYVVSIGTPGIVKQLDEKFIPDTIARTSDIPTVPTPNWNASQGQAGYIENRTHYEDGNTIVQLNEKFIPDTIARANDVEERFNALVIPDELADLKADATHRTVTDTEKANWNAKSNFSGNYNDLTNKPTIPSIAGLATEQYVTNTVADTKQWVTDTFATPNYVDTVVANMVDSAPETLNTLNELAAALGDDPNFATTIATQIGEIDSAKVDKITGKGLSTNDYTNEEKQRLATIAGDYLTSEDKTEIDAKLDVAYTHAENKGNQYSSGLYKITTNAEGHVTSAVAVEKADITALGIPAQDTDTGATSVEVTGAGNAITTASYDETNRKLTLTKGATYTNNQGTITGVTAGTSLSGGGTDGTVTIQHASGNAANKTLDFYKISTDATSHVNSVIKVNKEDIIALGIPAQDTTYEAMTDDEIDAICGQIIAHVSEVSW